MSRIWPAAAAVALGVSAIVNLRPLTAWGRELPFSPASPAQFQARVEKLQKTVRDLQARVSQKKFFPELGDEVTFTGTVVYSRPGKMRWEFTHPDPSSLLIKPDGVWLVIPE